MSDGVSLSLSKWGLPKFVFRSISLLRNKQLDPPFKIDHPDECLLGADYWHRYPVRNYRYCFNSWGFRDDDFDQYRKEVYPGKVNICVGDSFTMNLGGPREHSWPYLLSKRFQEPTLNISINVMSAHHYSSIVEKSHELFNINRVFLLYNLFDDIDIKLNSYVRALPADIVQRAVFLKKHCWVPNAYWQFVPPWAFLSTQTSYLYKEFPQAHDYFKNFNFQWRDLDYNLAVSNNFLNHRYQLIKSPSWLSYADFIKMIIIDHNIIWKIFTKEKDVKLVNEFLIMHLSKLLTRNRDGRHMSLAVHQALADYFYQQSTGIVLL